MTTLKSDLVIARTQLAVARRDRERIRSGSRDGLTQLTAQIMEYCLAMLFDGYRPANYFGLRPFVNFQVLGHGLNGHELAAALENAAVRLRAARRRNRPLMRDTESEMMETETMETVTETETDSEAERNKEIDEIDAYLEVKSFWLIVY